VDGLLFTPLIGSEGIRRGTRHKVIGKYPYTVVYRVKRDGIQVVRVLHQRREYFNATAGNDSQTR
jgi:plasmid stabilization system protein ParE